MYASHWDHLFPTAMTPLPSTANLLNFCIYCYLHNASLTSVADVDGHIFLHHTVRSQHIDWQCGHCAKHFTRDISIRQHIRRRHVRLATATHASFANKAVLVQPALFSARKYVFRKHAYNLGQ